jgi:hypothetical protein
MSRVIVLAFMALFFMTGAAYSQAPGGWIGIYADTSGVSNAITVPPFAVTQFYILAHPDTSNTNGGLQAAAFRVKYFAPPDLILDAMPNPTAHLADINPFRDESQPSPRGGASITWEAGHCQIPGATGMILLYTVDALALGPISNLLLEVDRIDNSYDPPWPYIFGCPDEDGLHHFEVDGLTATINGTTVSVDQQTWSGVKELFR